MQHLVEERKKTRTMDFTLKRYTSKIFNKNKIFFCLLIIKNVTGPHEQIVQTFPLLLHIMKLRKPLVTNMILK